MIVVFLRHGQTDYTGIFPDLTDEGKQTIRASAEEIKLFYSGHSGRLDIISSPTVRAKGSASIIAEALNFRDGIRESPLLRAAQVLDVEKGIALYQEHTSKGGTRGLSVAYDKDPRFEDGIFIEPRSEVRKRFFKYLGILARVFRATNSGMFVIHVSHYEVLYPLVQEIFQLDYDYDDPLSYGEVILISFHQMPSPDTVRLKISFRGKTADGVIFDHKKESIVAGSYL